MIIKGNQFEIVRAVFGDEANAGDIETIKKSGEVLSAKTGKPVIITMGPDGLRIIGREKDLSIPGIALTGQLDVCGAGDMLTAAFVSALASGADMETAGLIGNAAAAICVTQLGTSGYVTTRQIKELFFDNI